MIKELFICKLNGVHRYNEFVQFHYILKVKFDKLTSRRLLLPCIDVPMFVKIIRLHPFSLVFVDSMDSHAHVIWIEIDRY